MNRPILLLAAAACMFAQSGLDRPQVGEMLDARGVLWPVYGIAGSFTIGRAQARGVLATACSRQICFAKNNLAILAKGTFTSAPPGPAIIAVDGATAWLYFPEAHQFARWQNGALTPIDLTVDGDVLSIGPGPTIAVRRAGGIWIVSNTGAILDALPSTAGPTLLTGSGIVYATADSLVLRRSVAAELRFPASGITSLIAMGQDYVEAQSPGAIYALHTAAGSEHLFLLPQPSLALPSPRSASLR